MSTTLALSAGNSVEIAATRLSRQGRTPSARGASAAASATLPAGAAKGMIFTVPTMRPSATRSNGGSVAEHVDCSVLVVRS